MAVKWAVANGNWNNTAVWNGGTLPEDGDVVYMNGYNVTINTDINVGNGVITNKINPETSRTGGALVMPSTTTRRFITANIECGDTPMITALGGNITINGNVETGSLEGVLIERVGGVINLVIVGNVTTNQGNLVRYQAGATNYGVTISINGNLTTNQGTLITSYSGTASVTISGNINANARFCASNITSTTIIGSLLLNYVVLQTTTLNITGQIEYKSSNNIAGILYQNLTIGNPDTFTWKDITEPRVNPFIIVTDADMNNRQQYPPENEVKEGTEYVWGEKVGTYRQPPESVVLKGYRYDNDEKEGTLENENIVGCVTPEDVRKDVPLVGMGVVGSLVVPSADDVREGVHFDNDSVGTLIVQGGGDRLRIADFGYYTNAQSDTYIVDLTEQDKPKFAVAEERVLMEMFPDLDLDNIPDKYFDDLFVKYLKYRLIVEYYRTAGINSTFTPSEPITEIVNYQNVRNEVWLNSANIYLKAWAKKYPESITKPQRILL